MNGTKHENCRGAEDEHPPDDMGSVRWDREVDLLVVGSGAGGLSAAIFGRQLGLETLLCEKTMQLGGTTATSGGIVWAPGSHHAVQRGIRDSSDLVRTYLKGELGSSYKAELVDAFLESVPEAIAGLEKAGVNFSLTHWPDYHPERIGAAEVGRTLEAQRFDGRKLGNNFRLIRPPLPPLMLLGGMQVDKRKIDDFLNPFRSFATFSRVVETFLRYASDRLRFPRGTELCAGNAMVASMVHSILASRTEIWTSAKLTRLVRSSSGIAGAFVQCGDQLRAIRARKGVILATGGFPNNAEMRRELSADFPHDLTFGFEANVGEGIFAARTLGATLDREVESSGYWQPSSQIRRKDGITSGVLYGYLDRGRPGVIAVDRFGKRFVNESNSYHDVGLALLKNGYGKGNFFHFVCDRSFVWHHGLGLIRPFNGRLKKYEKLGYVSLAATISELAMKIGVDPSGLAQTVSDHNKYAEAGVDPDFGKGSTAYNRLFGHTRAAPNPNLAPIVKPPFVALRIVPSSLGTAIGLKTSGNAQVLDAAGAPIPGLYACGNDMASVTRGCYPAGGITLGPAIAFAYRAAAHAANATSETKRSVLQGRET
jgi:3-oxosteroid 1-dehydrogenase